MPYSSTTTSSQVLAISSPGVIGTGPLRVQGTITNKFKIILPKPKTARCVGQTVIYATAPKIHVRFTYEYVFTYDRRSSKFNLVFCCVFVIAINQTF